MTHNAEKAAGVEWQAAGASNVLHLIDTTRPAPRRSGARSACGRYPQRNHLPWFGLYAGETGLERAAETYRLTFCEDCRATRGPEMPTVEVGE